MRTRANNQEDIKQSLTREQRKSQVREAVNWIATAVGVPLIVTYLVFGVLFGIGVVSGWSMYPTLTDHSVFLFRRVAYTPDYGDIVEVKIEAQDVLYIKRVIGLPGDTIYIDPATASVYRNGELLDEPYLGTPTTDDGTMFGIPFTVSEECIFVMGDNRQYSTDSRDMRIGEIPMDDVMGKLLCVVWRGGGEPSYDDYHI